jgi:hypothetical protein
MPYSSIPPMPSSTTLSLLQISKSLPKTKQWLSMGLKAAILAVPLMVAAPSEATTFTQTISGFTGQFAGGNWQTVDPLVSGTAVVFDITPGVLRLAKSGTTNPNGIAGAYRIVDNSLFANLKTQLANPLAGDLISYSYSYNWSWWTSLNTTNNRFVFESIAGVTLAPGTTFNTSGGTFTSPLTGSFNGGGSSTPDTFGFQVDSLASVAGTGEARISNFQFIAIYDEVPGPLPILGAGAAFGLSRKLRRRLNSAKAVA